jgi:hypothetical protein
VDLRYEEENKGTTSGLPHIPQRSRHGGLTTVKVAAVNPRHVHCCPVIITQQLARRRRSAIAGLRAGPLQ